MKRLVLRMSALATVLVLGFIAIAQAQRGGEQPPESGGGSLVADATGSNATAEPRLLPVDIKANPLRSPERAVRTEALQTVATAEDKTNAPRVIEAAAAARRDATRPADPFSPHIGMPALNPAPQNSPTAGKTVQLSSALESPQSETGRDATASVPRASRIADSPSETLPPTVSRLPAIEPPLGQASTPSPASVPGTGSTFPAPRPQASALAAETRPGTISTKLPNGPTAQEPQYPKTISLEGAASVGGAIPSERDPERLGAAIAPKSGEPALFNPDSASPSTTLPRATNAGIAPPVGSSSGDPTSRESSGMGEGTGKPGDRRLEGPQVPQLTIHKTAPPEIQVGKAATFQITLKNTGQVTATGVELRDEIPKGARLVGSKPTASRGVRGELVWQLGSVKPGDETTVEVQLMAIDEGEIGSVASVTFHADASARTVATKPQLVIKMTGPNRVLIGDEVPLSVTISNPGSGIAQKIVLEERVPPGLQHPAGPDLEYEVGDLKPGETRQLELKLIAAQPGKIINLLAARGDGNLRTEDRLEVEVLAAQLDVALDGPKRRFLEREATYTFSVSNPGTAAAKQVELVAQLPPGLKFVSANNAGHYEDGNRTVHWTLEELPSKETGSVAVTTIPVEVGEQLLRLRGTADKGLSIEKEHPVMIEGIAAVMFEIVDAKDPIEVGGESTYEIRVVNQGSKAATNVQVTLTLPPEMKAIATEPPQAIVDPNRIAFEPLQHLAPKANTTYRVRVQGLKPGDLRIRAQLLTDEIRVPVTKEESTRVYSDE